MGKDRDSETVQRQSMQHMPCVIFLGQKAAHTFRMDWAQGLGCRETPEIKFKVLLKSPGHDAILSSGWVEEHKSPCMPGVSCKKQEISSLPGESILETVY